MLNRLGKCCCRYKCNEPGCKRYCVDAWPEYPKPKWVDWNHGVQSFDQFSRIEMENWEDDARGNAYVLIDRRGFDNFTFDRLIANAILQRTEDAKLSTLFIENVVGFVVDWEGENLRLVTVDNFGQETGTIVDYGWIDDYPNEGKTPEEITFIQPDLRWVRDEFGDVHFRVSIGGISDRNSPHPDGIPQPVIDWLVNAEWTSGIITEPLDAWVKVGVGGFGHVRVGGSNVGCGPTQMPCGWYACRSLTMPAGWVLPPDSSVTWSDAWIEANKYRECCAIHGNGTFPSEDFYAEDEGGPFVFSGENLVLNPCMSVAGMFGSCKELCEPSSPSGNEFGSSGSLSLPDKRDNTPAILTLITLQDVTETGTSAASRAVYTSPASTWDCFGSNTFTLQDVFSYAGHPLLEGWPETLVLSAPDE